MSARLNRGMNAVKILRQIFGNTALMAFLLSVAMFAVLRVIKPNAATLSSLSTVLANTSMLIFACAGQMIIITSGGGGIDLSAGAIMSTAAVITVETMNGDPSMLVPSFLLCLAAGALFGLLNGVGAAYIKIPALIMTLCVSNILGRFQLVISQGAPRGTVAGVLTRSLTAKYGVTPLLPDLIPGIAIWAAVFYAVVVLFLKYTKYGYRLSLIGTNFEAARLSGVRAKRTQMLAYVIGGMLAGLGGYVGAGYFRQMQPATFDGYTMQSIAAVVIGGTLLSGGRANYAGTVFGALLLTVLSQFLIAFNTSVALRYIIMGAMLIALLVAYHRKPAIRQ
ncbi:MAG: ABC transporter permease [Synergistaceae bacterium]|nr:ABC transporter permease [Synergistaceae bacterium]